ncbi:nickel ABC transporter permease subunit NikC [Bacillus sp. FJAT-27264]|uniref:nickel transporter permease n=1 Tax=Paenibacillus sp. (strain DSM 101736 / FJAT-27264) TaxID=1850362 RepID=UPI000807E174|nr:nickel transporter permease [Bacillus sp. FJAT-27264]OBZ19031.1 nickel ABC transporter permease subunit NikC [Bacillus sp. FJAT-27264]
MITLHLPKGSRAALAGGSIVLIFIVIGIFAPYLAPSDPVQIHMDHRLSLPSWQYPLGTDHLGRCVLSRLIYGTRTSLYYALIVLGVVFAISIPVGLIAGYAGGKLDQLIMRIIDILLAFPSLILALAVTGMLGPGPVNLLIAFAAVWWTGYARIIRGMVMQIKERDFILAAKAAGSSHLQIMVRHILANAARPILVLASMEVGTIILSLAGMSFLGLGAQPPTPEWGVMLNDSRAYIQTAPRLMLFPGLVILLVVVGFNLLGEGLRRADGRMHE